MSTNKVENGNNGNAGMKQSSRAEATSSPVRIRQKTRARLEQLIRQANKDRAGRRVKADDLILFALELMNDAHVAEICERTLSNRDRIEQLYRKMSKERRGLSRDDFFGILLSRNVTG